jgi:DNA-binding LacI/PurR family transcriptional regulator
MSETKSITLKDVAERAHVSPSVVSTVLNDRQNGIFVSEGTRRNVLQAAEDLHYVLRHRPLPPVRKTARRIAKTPEPHLVGVLLGRRFGGSLFTDTFYGINASLSSAGYHPLVLDTYAENYTKAAEKEAEGLRYARENGFAGIVLWHEGGTVNVPLIRDVSAEMPVIAIDRRVPGVPLDFVGTDNYQGAYEATQHLIAQGHTRIAHLTRLESTAAAVERMRGYQQALTDAGLTADPRHILLALDSGRRLNAEMLRYVFSSPERPTALFLLADFWAPPVYAELRHLGLRVPEDVALVGFDDVIQPGFSDLELTSMAQDFEGIGRTAGECVLRRLAQPDADVVSHVFPARLIARRSSENISQPAELLLEYSRPTHAAPTRRAVAILAPS